MAHAVDCQVQPRDREVLASWARSPSIRAGLARLARIVLLAADGLGTGEIVRRSGLSKPTVIFWKRRYAAEGTATSGARPGVATMPQAKWYIQTQWSATPSEAEQITGWPHPEVIRHRTAGARHRRPRRPACAAPTLALPLRLGVGDHRPRVCEGDRPGLFVKT